MLECTYKIATLNINGISATTRIKILEDFLYSNEIDLICLQEAMNSNINMIRNYSAHINLGSEGRRTAIIIIIIIIIIIKDRYTITDRQYIPTGRGIPALFNGMKTLNVYAPSGPEKNMKGKPSITWIFPEY
jgi:exonuclease III